MIRDATLANLDSICELEKQFGAEAFPRRSLRYLIKSKNAFRYLQYEDKIVGYYIVTYRNNSDKCRLYSILVDNAYQGKGFGKKLLADALQLFSPFQEMTLEVHEDNIAAIRLYEDVGFKQFGRIKEYYSYKKDALRMKKGLLYS